MPGQWTVRFHFYEDCVDLFARFSRTATPPSSSTCRDAITPMRCVAMLAILAALMAWGRIPCPPSPASVPANAPHYTPDVAIAIQANCTLCHTKGGSGASWPLTTYDEIYTLRFDVQSQIDACKMTPLGWPPMDPATRDMVLSWLVCGAPNN